MDDRDDGRPPEEREELEAPGVARVEHVGLTHRGVPDEPQASCPAAEPGRESFERAVRIQARVDDVEPCLLELRRTPEMVTGKSSLAPQLDGASG